MWSDVAMDLANVLVCELGVGFTFVVLASFVMSVIFLLADGIMGVPGCLERRAARKKEEYVALMREVLRDFRTNPVSIPEPIKPKLVMPKPAMPKPPMLIGNIAYEDMCLDESS